MVAESCPVFDTVTQAKSVGKGWEIFRASRWARYVGNVDPFASVTSAGKVQVAETPFGALSLPAVPAAPPGVAPPPPFDPGVTPSPVVGRPIPPLLAGPT